MRLGSHGSHGSHGFSDLAVFLQVKVDSLEPLLYIKARTVLANAWQVAMTEYLGIGIVEGETIEEFL